MHFWQKIIAVQNETEIVFRPGMSTRVNTDSPLESVLPGRSTPSDGSSLLSSHIYCSLERRLLK